MRNFLLWGLLMLVAVAIPEDAPGWLVWMVVGGTITGTAMGWFLTQKNKTIEELRERLGESESNSVYRNLTKRQLKNKTLTHSKKIRALIERKEWQTVHRNIMTLTKDMDEHGKPVTTIQKEYRDDGLHIETLRLRDELWARLPLDCRAGKLCSREGSCNLIYESPLNTDFMRVIANDLERLAHNLEL